MPFPHNPLAAGHPHLLTLATVLTLAASGATANTFIETFDGPLDPARWTLSAAGNNVSVQDGRFFFTRNGTGGAVLEYAESLVGDFDVQFSFDVTGWGSPTFGFGERLQLTVFPADGNSSPSFAVLRIQEGSFGAAFWNGSGQFCCSFGGNNANPLGGLRIFRVGSDITMQYAIGSGSFVTLATGQATQDMRVSLNAYLFNSSGSSHPSFAVDNFSITAGSVTPIPEPATGALLAAGLAAIGCAAQRRRAAQAAA